MTAENALARSEMPRMASATRKPLRAWLLSTGPKDESSLVSTAGNALTAHTRNEIHSEDRKQYVTNVWLPLTGPNGRVVTSHDCWKRAGPQRDCFRWPRQRRNHYVCSVWRFRRVRMTSGHESRLPEMRWPHTRAARLIPMASAQQKPERV